jgi:hypothetical protein
MWWQATAAELLTHPFLTRTKTRQHKSVLKPVLDAFFAAKKSRSAGLHLLLLFCPLWGCSQLLTSLLVWLL